MSIATKSSVRNDGDGRNQQHGIMTITQALLAEHLELKSKAERFRLLDSQIKDALDAGKHIERGPLYPEMNVDFKPRLLLDYIFESLCLSKQQIRKLRAEAPEVRYRSLQVVPNPSWDTKKTVPPSIPVPVPDPSRPAPDYRDLDGVMGGDVEPIS
jgi:hypothetical protein